MKEELEKLLTERIEKLRSDKDESYNADYRAEKEEQIDLLFNLKHALFGW